MYGSSAITPNMHQHCHLKEVILDYGPVYEFVCEFSDQLGDLCDLQQRLTCSLLLMAQDQYVDKNLKVELPSFYARHMLPEDE